MKKEKLVDAKNLRLVIVHEDVSNIDDPGPGGIKKWNVRRLDTVWNITRPDTGDEKLSMYCPYCKEKLEIWITSFEKYESNFTKYRDRGIASVIGCLIFGAGFFITMQGNSRNWIAAICLIGCCLCAILTAIFGSLRGNKNGLNATGSLTRGLLNERTGGPYDQHYIKSIERV